MTEQAPPPPSGTAELHQLSSLFRILKGAASNGSEHDVVLKHGDMLVVPRITQEVTVIGEVQSATSHLYRADLSRNDYIAMSGGMTPRADDDRIYVVRADGSVVARSRSLWFNGGDALVTNPHSSRAA